MLYDCSVAFFGHKQNGGRGLHSCEDERFFFFALHVEPSSLRFSFSQGQFLGEEQSFMSPQRRKREKKRCSCSCMEAFQADVSITGTGEGGGCTHVMHGRSRMTI